MDERYTEATTRAPAGARIRLWREKLGWSQQELACRADLSWSSISAYERGIAEVRFAVAVRIANALGLHVALLWDVLVSPSPSTAGVGVALATHLASRTVGRRTRKKDATPVKGSRRRRQTAKARR